MGDVQGGTSVAEGKEAGSDNRTTLPSPGKATDNPRSHFVVRRIISGVREKLERVMGIEPTFEAWEAPVLPLNYTRINLFPLRFPSW